MRSESYLMTVDTRCAGSMLELENVRKAISIVNKENKRMEKHLFEKSYFENSNSYNKLPRYRVKCQGRGPRTAAAMLDSKHPRSYDQSLPLKHAEKMDVYVYRV